MTFTKVQSGFVDLTTSSGLTVGAGNASTPHLTLVTIQLVSLDLF